MADWTENMLFVRGSERDLERWNKKLMEGTEKIGKLSFEKLIPSPKDGTDWYQWNKENWGVKWDTAPYGSAKKFQEGYLYAFMAPWDTPIALIEKFSNIYADLNFELRYLFQYTNDGGVFYSTVANDFTDLKLNYLIQPEVFEKLLLEPFGGYRRVLSMFG